MCKLRHALLLLALLAAPAAAAAQDGAAAPDWSRAEERREDAPFVALLRHQRELRLSREQVARLEAVGRALEERNRPLRQQLRRQREAYVEQRRAQVRRLSPEQRRDTLRRLRRESARGEGLPPEMKPVVERMRSNTRRAMVEAQRVLTPEQKRRARALVRERREEIAGERLRAKREARRARPRDDA